jgi:hypothetical protein
MHPLFTLHDLVPASALSPTAEPFLPGIASADRAMVSRWMDYSNDDYYIDTGEVAAPKRPSSTPSVAILLQL